MDTENPREDGLEHGVNKKITRRTLLLIAGAATVSVIGICYKMGLFDLLFEETTTPPESEGSDARYTVTPEPTTTPTPEPTPTPELYERPPDDVIPGSKAEIIDYSDRAVELAYERLNYPAEDPRHEEAEQVGRDWMYWAVQGVAARGFSDEDVIAISTHIFDYLYEGCGGTNNTEESSKRYAQTLRDDPKTKANERLENRCNSIFDVSPGADCS